MKTWYQVTVYPNTFGFAVVNNTIVDHPNRIWIGLPLSMYKPELIKLKAFVYKIC